MSAAKARKPRKTEPQAPRLSAVVPLRDPSAVGKPVAETITSAQQDVARLIALYDSPGFLDLSRARAALWLLEQIDGGHLTFSHNAMSAELLKDWCRGIVKDAIATSLAAAEEKIAEAAGPGVVPIRQAGAKP